MYLIAVMTETSPTPCLLVNWDEPDSLRKEHYASDQEHLPQPPDHKKTAPWDESGQRDVGKNYRRESYWSRLCARLCCVLNTGKIIGLFLWLVIVKIRVVLNLHWVGRHRGWTAMWLDNLGLPQSWSTVPSPCPFWSFGIHQPWKVLKWFWPFLTCYQFYQDWVVGSRIRRRRMSMMVRRRGASAGGSEQAVLLCEHPLLMSTSEEDSSEKNRRPLFPSQEEEGEERQ